MEGFLIRNYEPRDKKYLRRIFCDTAFRGEPAEVFFDGREILADVFTLYYTDYEPQSSFVAESGGRIIGYLNGCKDSRAKNRIFLKKIFPGVLAGFIFKGYIFRYKNIKFIFQAIKSFFADKHPPEISAIYPAHLHINVDENFRKQGVGNGLLETFFGYLKKTGIKGVYASTFSEKGRNFFIKTGFSLLWEGKTSQWRYITGGDINAAIFTKTLE